jgi:putative transposase
VGAWPVGPRHRSGAARALGPDATVSKSTVSRICEQIKDEFDTWRTRDLSEVSIDYLFVDAVHFKMHDGARSEPVLVAYGITTEGNSVLLHLDGSRPNRPMRASRSSRTWSPAGWARRCSPITDGAPGLCAAIDQVFPTPAASAA